MSVKLKANSSFTGTEGFIKAGEVFEVENEDRADKLVEELKLADYAKDSEEVTAAEQVKQELEEKSKTNLQKIAEDEGVEDYEDLNKGPLIDAIIENRNDGAQ